MKQYKAVKHNGAPIITVLAENISEAYTAIMEQLSRNPSRSTLKSNWRAANRAIKLESGITVYWAHSLGKWVTIPEEEL